VPKDEWQIENCEENVAKVKTGMETMANGAYRKDAEKQEDDKRRKPCVL